VIWLGTRQQLSKLTENRLTLPNATVQFSTVVNDLGVLIDSQLSMSNHIAALSRSCFFHLRQLRLKTVSDAGGDEHTRAGLHRYSAGLLQQCTCRRQQPTSTQDAGDTECRRSFHHRSQEIRAHDASVTQPPLATNSAWDQV